MAFKFVLSLCSLLALANAGGIVSPITYAATPVFTNVVNPSVDAIASTQQNVVRSFGGTVSSYSKSVDTPYSSVHKTDTRISNNIYTPGVAKTLLTYAAPVSTLTNSVYAAPAVAHGAPAFTYASDATYAPVHTHHTYGAVPAPAVYSHSAPAYAPTVKQGITYSSAANVAHVSFDGLGAHWGY